MIMRDAKDFKSHISCFLLLTFNLCQKKVLKKEIDEVNVIKQ